MANSDAAFQLMQALNLTLLGVDWKIVDNQQMKAAVLEHIEENLACDIAKGGTEGEDWKEMLTRVVKSFLMIDKTKGLVNAAKRRAGRS